MSGLSGRSFNRYQWPGALDWGCKRSPVDTLRKSRTERVGAGASEDIDKSTWIEDHLKSPQFSTSRQRSPCAEAPALPVVFTYRGEIGENWASLSAAIDVRVIAFADGA